MEAERFRACQAACDWSAGYLAERLGCDARLVRRWASGRNPVPDNVAAWLEGWAEFSRGHRVPEGWVVRAREGPTEDAA